MPRTAARAILYDDATLALDGHYLKSFDLEADDGRGRFEFTDNPEEAFVFLGLGELLAWRHTSPRCHPIRETDGKPNRPATRFTIEIETLSL